MDKEFLALCIVIIRFFKKTKSLSDSASHLLDCLSFTVLLRDEFEKMLRILLLESQTRNLNLRDYLEHIKELECETQIVEITIDGNQLSEDS